MNNSGMRIERVIGASMTGTAIVRTVACGNAAPDDRDLKTPALVDDTMDGVNFAMTFYPAPKPPSVPLGNNKNEPWRRQNQWGSKKRRKR